MKLQPDKNSHRYCSPVSSTKTLFALDFALRNKKDSPVQPKFTYVEDGTMLCLVEMQRKPAMLLHGSKNGSQIRTVYIGHRVYLRK